MIEFAYWHWLILGLILLIAELLLTSFIALWFGLGALLVSLVVWFGPTLSLASQIFLWLLASCVFTFVWFRWVWPRISRGEIAAGNALEAVVGRVGVVIRAPENDRRGVLRLSMPWMGSDEWSLICDQSVVEGDCVVVRDVLGNALVVEKQSSFSNVDREVG